MRTRNVFLTFFAVIVITLVIGVFFFSRSAYLLNRVRIVIVDELENQLNHPVTIGKISGNVLTGLKVHQLEVAKQHPDKPNPILIDEVNVKYRLWGLMQGKFVVQRFNLYRPQINAYIDRDGKFNLSSLMPEKTTESSARRPQLVIARANIEDGGISFVDETRKFKIAISGIHSLIDNPKQSAKYNGSMNIRDGSFELNGISTQIDELVTEFEFLKNQGELKTLRLTVGNSSLTISGGLNNFNSESPSNERSTPILDTQIGLNVDLRDLQKYVPTYELEGFAQAAIQAKGWIGDIVGQCNLKLPQAKINQIPLENWVADAEFTQDRFHLNAINGELASGSATGDAVFKLASEGVKYNGSLQLSDLQAHQVLPTVIELPEDFLVVNGRVNGKILFRGGSANLNGFQLDSNLELSEASLNDVPIRLSKARCDIENNRLSVSANLDDAEIRLNGPLGSADPSAINLNITQIDVGKLSRILSLPDLSGSGTLTGRISPNPPLTATFSIPDAALYDVPIGVLRAEFHYAEGRVTLHPVSLVKGESEIMLTGVARMENDIPVDFSVTAQPLQIADYVRLAGDDYPIEGIATGELKLDGTLASLDGRGNLHVAAGQAWELALDPLTLPLEIQDYVVKTPNFEILVRGQRGVLNTELTPDGDYDISFQSEAMRLAELARAKGITDFQLDADLVVLATGRANVTNPRVDLSFDFSKVSYAGKPLRDVHLEGIYMGDKLHFEGSGFDNTCRIQGVMESVEGNPYKVFVDGKGVDVKPILRIFNDTLSDKITGSADGALEISGTLADTSQFTLNMTLPSLALHANGRQLINPSTVKLSFADDVWQVDSFELADSRDRRRLLRAAGTLGAAAFEPDPPSSTRPSAEKVLPRERFDFTVESEGFALEYLTDILGMTPMVSGTARYKLTGNGTAEDAQLVLDWSLENLSVNLPLEPVTISEAAGRLVYKNRNLIVEQSNFLWLDNSIHVDGSVPLNLSALPMSFEDRIAADAMRIEFRGKQFHLAPLTKYLPQLSHLHGYADLSGEMTGSLQHPVLTASVDVKETEMQLFDFPQPIENLQARIRIHGGGKSQSDFDTPLSNADNARAGFTNDLISVELEFVNWNLAGGNYRAAGRWNLSKTKAQSSLFSIPSFHAPASFQLQLDGRQVNLTKLVNYVMRGKQSALMREYDLEGHVDVSLALQGSGFQANQVSGTLKCSNLRASINKLQFDAEQKHLDELNRGGISEALGLLFSKHGISIPPNSSFTVEKGDGGRTVIIWEDSNQPYVVREGSDKLLIYKKHNVQNLAPIICRYSGGGFTIESFHIGQPGGGFIDASGTCDTDGNLNLQLELSELPYALLLPSLTLTLFNTSALLDGRFSSRIALGGTLTEPTIDAEWDTYAKSKNAEFSDKGFTKYNNRTLVMGDTIRLGNADNQLSISGEIPINLSFQPLNLPERFPELPMNLQLKGKNESKIMLDYLALLFPVLLEDSGGIAEVDFSIRGTTASPYLVGEGTVHNGMMKFKHLDTPISGAAMRLKASAGKISIPAFSFQIGAGEYAAPKPIEFKMNGLLPTDFEVQQFTVTQAQISDFARSFLTGEIISDFEGFVTAEARLRFPINRIITPGETAWTPKIALPDVHNLIEYAVGDLNIQHVLVNSMVEGLDYTISNPEVIKVRLKDRTVKLDDFTLEDQKSNADAQRLKMTGSGSWKLGGRLDFRMDMHHFNLGFISDFFPDAYAIRGFLNAVLDIRGTDANPEVIFEWETPRFSLRHAHLDEFTGKIVYKNKKLRLTGIDGNNVRFSVGANRAKFSGLIPFNLSFLEFKAEPLQHDEIEGRLDAAIRNLDFLPLIIPSCDFADGTGEIGVTIGGPLRSPQLKGVANLRNLEFDFPDSYTKIEKTEIDIDFTHGGLNIRRFDGRLNGGAYRINGSVESDWHRIQNLNLTAALSGGCVFEMPGVYWVELERADLAINGGLKLPELTGSIHITEGRYENHWRELVENWFDKDAGIQTEVWFDYPIVRDLRLNLAVFADDNLRMESDIGELEVAVSVVNGKIVGPIQKPIFDGRVNLLEGQFSLLDHLFSINEGSFIENTNPFEFNPQYKIDAETIDPIRNIPLVTTDDQERTKDLNIKARLSGYLNEHRPPEFQVEVLRKSAGEEYQFTSRQIVRILSFGGADTSEPLSAGATSNLLLRHSQRFLGSRVADAVGFVDDVRFDISPSAFEASQFFFTKAISERFFLTSGFTFQLHTEPRIEVEYLINRHITVKGEKNEQGKFGIDLKLQQKFGLTPIR
ncbi:MAG: translocation/assembly module TamB domain-containing protein [Candidatus Poribacteria bacterium]|nr:translocation/assembly module TamB domain-containing protein [Candidatus Poribacteria bacterium]